uniref:RELT-like 1 n=1 Tax=Mus musculus TaxID=10090 RepID=H7BX61_MOUSE
MALWGLPGSAVLAASVFVGGAVSSPLVAADTYTICVVLKLFTCTRGSSAREGAFTRL